MSESFVPKTFIAGAFPLLRDSVTLATGNLTRGSVLGKITTGGVTAAAKTGGNTGQGTCTVLAAKSKTKLGVYVVRCIATGTGVGTFSVVDPDGERLEDATASAGGVTYNNRQITFKLIATGTDYALGDGFDITVAAGSGQYKLVNSASVDGSQNPVAVLAEDMDATSAVRTVSVYITGEFVRSSLVFGGSDTYATHQDAMRARSMFCRDIQTVGGLG